MIEYVSIAAINNMHFIVYRYRCKGRYYVNIHLKCLEEFDHDWRMATTEAVFQFDSPGGATVLSTSKYGYR